MRFFVYHDLHLKYERPEEHTLKNMLTILGNIIKMQEDAASHSVIEESTDFLSSNVEKWLAVPGLATLVIKKRKFEENMSSSSNSCVFCSRRHASEDCHTYTTVVAHKA